MLESIFKSKLKKELENIFPGSIVIDGNANEIQGFPDVLILYKNKWAALECKQNENSTRRPNQEYYIGLLNDMSYASFIWPDIKEEVLNELQQALTPRRMPRVPKR